MAETVDCLADQLTERLAYIRTRDEEATPAPWEPGEASRDGYGLSLVATTDRAGFHRDEKKEREVARVIWDSGTHRDQMEANAEFIIHAREDLPFLADQIDQVADGLRAMFPEDEDWLTLVGYAVMDGRMSVEQGRALSAVRAMSEEVGGAEMRRKGCSARGAARGWTPWNGCSPIASGRSRSTIPRKNRMTDTRTPVSELDGRELDAAVAREVFGASKPDSPTGREVGGAVVSMVMFRARYTDESGAWMLSAIEDGEDVETMWVPLPFSSHIKAAWAVVDRFDGWGGTNEGGGRFDDGTPKVVFMLDGYAGEGRDVKEAICRAALKAVREEEP